MTQFCREMKIARDMPIFSPHLIWLCLGNESQAYSQRTISAPRLPATTIAGRS
jgi:hypothetical protein